MTRARYTGDTAWYRNLDSYFTSLYYIYWTRIANSDFNKNSSSKIYNAPILCENINISIFLYICNQIFKNDNSAQRYQLDQFHVFNFMAGKISLALKDIITK